MMIMNTQHYKLLHWGRHLDIINHALQVNRLGIISDFDGTLSHFVDDPALAKISGVNACALNAIATKVALLALVSGRSADDLRARFIHPQVQYHGNHGLDYWQEDGLHTVEDAKPWSGVLRELLAELAPNLVEGALVENKGVTASIHYRNTVDPAQVSQSLRQQLEPLCRRYGFRLNAGHCVWELKPPIAVDKGTVLQNLVAEHHLEAVIFLGDDTTDVTAMRRLWELHGQGLRTISVGVLHDERAPSGLLDYCNVVAYGPDDVAQLLCWIEEQI